MESKRNYSSSGNSSKLWGEWKLFDDETWKEPNRLTRDARSQTMSASQETTAAKPSLSIEPTTFSPMLRRSQSVPEDELVHFRTARAISDADIDNLYQSISNHTTNALSPSNQSIHSATSPKQKPLNDAFPSAISPVSSGRKFSEVSVSDNFHLSNNNNQQQQQQKPQQQQQQQPPQQQNHHHYQQNFYTPNNMYSGNNVNLAPMNFNMNPNNMTNMTNMNPNNMTPMQQQQMMFQMQQQMWSNFNNPYVQQQQQWNTNNSNNNHSNNNYSNNNYNNNANNNNHSNHHHHHQQQQQQHSHYQNQNQRYYNNNNNNGNNKRKVNNRARQQMTTTDPLLLEHKATGRMPTYEELTGRVVTFCRDAQGSRCVQYKMENASPNQKELLVQEVLPSSLDLMEDLFGNYVMQNFIEHGTEK